MSEPAAPATPFFSAAVEGDVDEAVLRRLLLHAGAQIHKVYGKRGKGLLRRTIVGYNEAARYSPWIVLVDLNHESPCAPELRKTWLPAPAEQMHFRVAVREIEAWLLGDPETFARFLSIRRSGIPADPDGIEDPKELIVTLSQGSRSSVIRREMVPRPGSGRSVGPAYSSRLIEYAETAWQPEVAAQNSESLRRCALRLSERIAGGI